MPHKKRKPKVNRIFNLDFFKDYKIQGSHCEKDGRYGKLVLLFRRKDLNPSPRPDSGQSVTSIPVSIWSSLFPGLMSVIAQAKGGER